jgi:thioredoxin 1
MSGKYFEATDGNFQSAILESGQVSLVDFWATWCGPCLMLAPTIEALAGEYEGRAIIAKVNVDENPNTAGKYGIRRIPTMLIIKNGAVVDQLVGNVGKSVIAAALDKHLG